MSARHTKAIFFGTALAVYATCGEAGETNEAALPAAAEGKIDFARDIQPILQENCLRCHGSERPKSNFRLTDRASALKGGANGVAVIPGDSAKSPLIHYIAGLVPEMEMPPPGKGDSLSTEQISQLRAWIDQGALWDSSSNAVKSVTATLEPVAIWTGVSGNQSKFRELEWQPEGWNGGAEKFEFSELFPDGRGIIGEGHITRDDYRITLELKKPDLGFAKFGFQQYRKYFDDSGGYYAPFSPPLYELGNDLHLDIGRAWVEAGLTLPDWPRIVAGYEIQYKDGSKSMLSWGPVDSASGDFMDARSIYPSFMNVDENTHIIRLDISYDLHGFEFQDNVRAEIYNLNTTRFDALHVPAGGAPPDLFAKVTEAVNYKQIANTALLQKEIKDWWIAGIGYRYSWLDGSSDFNLSTEDSAGQPSVGSAWAANNILLSEVWQVGNANSQFKIGPHLTAALGFQGQWKQQETFGDVNLDEVVDPADPTGGISRYPVTDRSTLDLSGAEENVAIRFTGLPFTSLFADARLKQQNYSWRLDQSAGPHDAQVETDARVRWEDFLVGFSSSPWRNVTFGGHYRHRDRTTDYSYPLARSDGAYPGFITAREITADEVEARVTLRPALWLKTTLIYRWLAGDFHTTTGATSPDEAGPDATPGGTVLAGQTDSQTLSANVALTPFRRASLAATVSWQHSQTRTADNGNDSVIPYAGNSWAAFGNATYSLDTATDLFAGASYAAADYAQNNVAAGLPLGIDYDRYGAQIGVTRRFSKRIAARLLYGFYAYREPSSAHLHNYTANQILALLDVRW